MREVWSEAHVLLGGVTRDSANKRRKTIDLFKILIM